MPRQAPIAKLDAAAALGATVHLRRRRSTRRCGGAPSAPRRRDSRSSTRSTIPDVIAGSGRSRARAARAGPGSVRDVVVPVGGGGLVSGIAIAIKSLRPDVEVVGVQVEACAPFPPSLAAGRAVAVDSALTIADGIAVKRPGRADAAADRASGSTSSSPFAEDEVAEAMVFLLERAKLVVEGAGAVGVAALLCGRLRGARRWRHDRRDPLGRQRRPGSARPRSRAATRARSGRRLVLLARLPDRPGSLARLLALVGEQRREPPRRHPYPRGPRPPRARDRGAARARDARPGPRAGRDRGDPRRGLRRAVRAVCGSGVPARRARRSPGSSRLPQGATGRRARTGLPTTSIASGSSSSVEWPVTVSPSPIVATLWWWCDLVAWRSSPAARLRATPGRGQRRGRCRRTCRGCGGALRGRRRRGRADGAFRRARR